MQPSDFFLKGFPLYFALDGTIAYPGCPAEGCNKKVIEEAANQWRCEKCQKTYPNCQYRFSLNMSFADFTGQTWIRAFGDAGEAILNQTADQVMDWKNSSDPNFDIVFQEALHRPFLFKVRAKFEIYEGNPRTALTAQGAYPLDFQRDSRRLIAAIAEYE